MGYIYKITNLINGKVYIGQTKRTIEIRWRDHVYDSKKSKFPIHRAIRKYGVDNFKIEILEECENDKLDEKEIYWIKEYNSTNSDKGYNATSGGDTNYEKAIEWIHNHPEEVKNNLDKAREIAIKKFEDNPELKAKRERLRMEGYKKYIEENKEEWLENQREKLKKGRQILKEQYEKDPTEIINRARENGKKASKAVKQIDKKTGEVIQIFESLTEAGRACSNNPSAYNQISRACNGKSNTAYGFKWAYVET